MQYRRMGRSGLKLSAVSLGAWATFGERVGRSEARELIAQAYAAGINFFDNAESYAQGEAERLMGDVIADLRLSRDAYCVSSKVMWGSMDAPRPTQVGLSRKHVAEARHQALKRLRVEYLDLYLCHRPDPDTPVEETVWAMDTLIRQGKVLYWGTSEWPSEQIAYACRVAQTHHLHGPSVEQPQYNLLCRERVELEYAPLIAEWGLGLTVFSPLASGQLSGKYRQRIAADTRLGTPGYEWLQHQLMAEDGRRAAAIQRFVQAAQNMNLSPAVAAIAWCLRNPLVSTVLLGATRPEQLAENLRAVEIHASLSEHAMQLLEAAVSG